MLFTQPHRSVYPTLRVDNKYPSSVLSFFFQSCSRCWFNPKKLVSNCVVAFLQLTYHLPQFLVYEGYWRRGFRRRGSEFQGTNLPPVGSSSRFSHPVCATKIENYVRSHPDGPDKPSFEMFTDLMAAPIDKLKEIFVNFPAGEQK